MANNVSSEAAAAAALLILMALHPARAAEDGPGDAAWPPLVGATEAVAADRRSGLALHGFDAVSYRLGAVPRPGRPEFELIWAGVAWRFASAANREAFRRDPEAYAPRIGGFDAAAVSEERLAPGEPTLHAVAGRGLYLFRDAEARERFLADPAMAARAERAWPALRRGLAGS